MKLEETSEPLSLNLRLMRTFLYSTLLIFSSSLALGQVDRKNELVAFKWQHQRQALGNIQVPPGYKEETKVYAEGVLTVLTYADGSYIVLHTGGMIKLPFFTEPEHQARQEQILPDRIIRSGKMRNLELFWREENSQGVWPPTNIGFTNVTKERLKLFEKSLRSFVRTKKM
jgi:hypothetical protein